MALKQVKNKIISTKKTGQVTKAMESVSAVKMRKSQERAISSKPYAEAAVKILSHISGSRDAKSFLTIEPQKDSKHCFVAITSDKGLAGALNSAVLKEVTSALQKLPLESVRIIAFGKKAIEYFTRLGYTLDGQFANVSDNVSIEDMEEVTDLLNDKFITGEYSHVSVAYQNFVSTFEQNALVREILPLNTITLEQMIADIASRKDGQGDTEDPQSKTPHVYNVEPSPEQVYSVLLPQLIQVMIFHSLLENKASEHSARMVAMKNATDKSKELIKALTIEYNKERQASITAEVSEITAGAEAMNN